ncbi:response regulator [Streptomyces sp. ICN441]|uniref:Circadian input-output histidine kinase CikA n=1 Tax=Streptomyces tirandamycinicus TaxID=2174846 RepID=A0A2S1T0F7_9ACTN|nr:MULTISPECIES: HAMP domain-containing protein [Streptomyces]AWI32154.1 hybrid sensor histidine kinase/response regulator [Streptomyces tirandamycinicus]TFE36199.1 response regulator [Streptomyces sp. ICN441]
MDEPGRTRTHTGREHPEGARPPAELSEEGLRTILAGLAAVRDGDFSSRLPEEAGGIMGEIAAVYNGMADQLALVASEVTRVASEVGGEGRLGGHARVEGVGGVWQELTTGVNTMADNLTSQVRSIAQVASAVARGDLTQKIRVDARGEILELKETINTMVERLSSFAEEVTRVAREVGTEGDLGGQATVRGVSGTWKDLTDNVNSMATNLTNQVRNIAQVTTAVARGDLTRRIDVDARGEILELKTTINTMVDQLSSFAAEVTRVAREVGSEGRLGGQAEVEGVSGTWKRLTENVNELAGNLTRQVRAIAGVTSAVAEGDLTRSITVEAPGEVGDLKDNINAMVESLRATTRANEEQDWLKTNLARLAGLTQGSRDPVQVAHVIMEELPPLVSAQYGAFFLAAPAGEGPGDGDGDGRGEGVGEVVGEAGTELVRIASYGAPTAAASEPPVRFRLGESLVGQAALSRRTVAVDDLPPGYVTISSGLGAAPPAALIVLPILVEDQVLGAVELASVRPFSGLHRDFLDQFVESVGVVVSSLIAHARTDELLEQSQLLTAELRARSQELQVRQEELQSSNAELAEKAALLADRNRDIERKNLEIEQARQELEERAKQLSRTSMYKSEFLANMSHELRTPLNSLLILAQLLAQNPEGNLTEKQVDYAEVIHSAGSDLLQLINDILDLSKVEAGKMDIHREPFALGRLLEYVEMTFRPLATERELGFRVVTAPGVPAEITTDEPRLRQVLRNLLSNALKFTERGGVELRVQTAADDELPDRLRGVPVVAFRVRDTGVGIAPEHLDTIFGAFQQGALATGRRYGGTGLGLSISREVAQLLGGVIVAESRLGEGSEFTFYVPVGGTLPRGPASGAREGPLERGGEAPAAGGGSLAGRVVLIVDDDVRNVYAITEILEAEGAHVLTAADGRSGIELLTAHREVDLIVMDVMMSGMDGHTATAAIRGTPGFSDVPIITVTAKAMPGDRARSLESGANDYLTKPVDAHDLVERVHHWLDRD